MKKNLFFISLIALGLGLNAQTTVTFTPSQDNTLYQNASGTLSNGSGTQLFSGRTNQPTNNLRRALVQFDLSSLPSNITINSASLRINVNKQKGGSHTHNLHLVTKAWGESTSVAGGQQGGGGTAAAGDATWIHSLRPGTLWTNPGGDFVSTSSASSNISGNGAVTFTSAQLTADVQRWIDTASSNHGWIIIGNEGSSSTAKRFSSREVGTSANRPTLSISYSVTGITETANSKLIKVYPNPAEDYIIIENRKNMFQPNVIIHDVSGQEVMNEPLHMDNKIDISNLSPGVYFIELISLDNKERIVKKIVKQ